MQITTSNRLILRGKTYKARVRVKDDSGADLDLTGKGLVFTLVATTQTAPLLSLTVGAGVTLDDQVTAKGHATVKMTAVQTAELTEGERLFDVTLIDGADVLHVYPVEREAEKITVKNAAYHP